MTAEMYDALTMYAMVALAIVLACTLVYWARPEKKDKTYRNMVAEHTPSDLDIMHINNVRGK